MINMINKWAKNWVFYHVIFWISMFFTFFTDVIEYINYDLIAFTTSILIRLVLLAILIYGNILFLIPRFLNKKRNLLYWISLIVLVAIFSFFYRAIYFKTTDVVVEIPRTGHYVLNTLLAIRYLFISYLFIFLKGWFEQESKISQFKVDQLSTELKLLRAQVNPHFLFNTLNNLYGLALKKSDKTPEIIMRLSDMMDFMLYDANEAKVPLKKDVDNLVNYVEIEKIRQGNNAKINFSVTGEMKTQKIIPLLMLSLLENGFKHGINREPANAYIDASVTIDQEFLEFKVVNNKVPAQEAAETSHGIGLKNLRKRLNLFYPKKHELIINESADSFSALLKIHLA